MTATEIIGFYHDLWRVEQSFRMSKTDLRARPTFHRTRDAIEAHLTIVFTALALSPEQSRPGPGSPRVTSLDTSGPFARPPSPSTAPPRDSPPAITAKKQTILDAGHDRKFTH